MKFIKTVNLVFYFIIALFFMETILRLCTTGEFFSSGFIFSFLFSISLAIIFYIICSFFEDKICYILGSIFLGLSALIFSSQLIYFKFFRTFYSLYSAGNSSQVFEFWKDIITLLAKNFIWIILIFLPFILILIFGKKILSFKKIKWSYRVVLVSCIFLSHVIGLANVYIGERTLNSPYDLYFKTDNPILSVEKLGLITTMRIDLQRIISGWSPVFDSSSLDLLSSPPVKTKVNTHVKVMEPLDSSNLACVSSNTIKKEKLEYNTLNIDFENLISNEKDEVIKDMHKYFNIVQPTTKNEYTGKYKGYNLILITAESFSPYAVREDLTPTLYKMIHDGYNFTDFYNPIWGVSTSDGEYVACTSLVPKSGVWSFYKSGNNYMPFVMGNQFKNIGYKTMAYHNHSYTYYKRNISHPNMGYEYKGLGNGLNVKKTWPESDLEMMEKTVSDYINNQPFHAYYMTVSGHMQYSFNGNSMSLKNRDTVKDLPYSEQAKAYISCNLELEKAMSYLLNALEEAGIADKTLIALSADHYPYGLEDKTFEELAGHPVEKNFELFKSPFILYTKGMEPTTIDKPCSSLDIIPTLSNILGLEYDSRLLMGRDIFSDSEPLVLFLNKSFITDKGRYNSKTGEFISKEGATFDEDYIKRISTIVNSKFHYSAKILETDYYNKILKEMEN
ncbi:LTA synthase family protein [Oceanirhabdus seepicola]|uniref:Sulfatase-like hydrolase/transferase n=1 Tax=Oceanirhabdus seepicola TaxID=2828781 RepID=A0A9J6P6G2_9CLOT|nr:LTA synthase family protein [Oceanirhabdus seepicola]MCM1991718.1 sulfatase-like hydrolase/transferase [Oceanirhabdus seepicola]